MEFWVNRDIRRNAFDLTVIDRVSERVFAGNVVMQEYADGVRIEPTLRLERDAAEQLMTELWNAGVRPAGVGTTGELASVRYHLEDMRRLVFETKKD